MSVEEAVGDALQTALNEHASDFSTYGIVTAWAAVIETAGGTGDRFIVRYNSDSPPWQILGMLNFASAQVQDYILNGLSDEGDAHSETEDG